MAGGTWMSQNKVQPGVYINTKSSGNLSASVGEKGVVAIAEPLSWGPCEVLHTIIPGFLMKDGKAVGPFGVMGGFMQPQGHVQVIMNTLDFMMNPQETLDAPRWQWVGGKKIQVEKTFPAEIVEELKRRGHEMEVLESSLTFGRGQIIWRDENGVLCGATEPRADGAVAVL